MSNTSGFHNMPIDESANTFNLKAESHKIIPIKSTDNQGFRSKTQTKKT